MGKKPEDIVYSPTLYDHDFKQEEIFRYIIDPESEVKSQANKYLNSDDHILEAMKYGLMHETATREALQDIIDDKTHMAHKQRDIIDAIKTTEAKTVRVTIDKDNKELTFRNDTRSMARTGSNEYYAWDIIASDRSKYKELYGHDNYGVKDIVKINYGKKEIYNREINQRNREKLSSESLKKEVCPSPSLSAEIHDANAASSALDNDFGSVRSNQER